MRPPGHRQRFDAQIGLLRCQISLDAPETELIEFSRRLSRFSADTRARSEHTINIEIVAAARALLGPNEGYEPLPDGDGIAHADFRVRHTDAAGSWSAETYPYATNAENALRWVVARELLNRGGLLLHGASVRLGDAAHVFTGASGAGKSTIAFQGDFDAVLCDELSIVCPDSDGRWQVWPSPFWGREEQGENGPCVPLKAVWVLVGRATNWSQPFANRLAEVDAIVKIFARIPDLGGGAVQAFDVAASLVSQVPVASLCWRIGDDLKQHFAAAVENGAA